MKKTTYMFIQMSRDAVSELLQEKLPIKMSLQIIRNTSKVEAEMKIAFEMQKTIQSKYKAVDESGNKLDKLDQTKIEDFNKEMNEFMKEEILIDLNPIKISELENIKDITIKPATLTILTELGLLIE